jgi:hypothetical protein
MFLIFLSHINAQVKSTTQVNNNPCTNKKPSPDTDTQLTQLLSYKVMKVRKREGKKRYREGCAKLVVPVVYQAYCNGFHTCAGDALDLCMNPLMRCVSKMEFGIGLQFRT